MPLGLGQGSLAAPWDLALVPAPMKPPPHTLVKEGTKLSFSHILCIELASSIPHVTNTPLFVILQQIANELSNQFLLLQGKEKLAVQVENNAKQKSNSLS